MSVAFSQSLGSATTSESDETYENNRAHKKTVMKLTARGKAVLAGLGAAVLLIVGMGFWNTQIAQSAPATQEVTSYVVRPGDTLWSYAASITEAGGDVNETIAQIEELNGLHSAAITAGQRLVVPSE